MLYLPLLGREREKGGRWGEEHGRGASAGRHRESNTERERGRRADLWSTVAFHAKEGQSSPGTFHGKEVARGD